MKTTPLKNRHLFHIDCNFIFGIPKIDNSPIKAMHSFLDNLVDAGIDTLLTCPNSNVAWYPSKVWPTAIDGYTKGDRDFRDRSDLCDDFEDATGILDTVYDLKEAGIDWLAEVAGACRQRGIAPWLSVRMNDIHAAADPDDWPGSPFEGNPDKKVKNTFIFPHQNDLGINMGLDYGLPEVRDHMLTLIREVINDYDFEGIELDWMRDPFCCEPPATEAAIADMKEWQSEIRDLARKKEKATGKPYALGIKSPPNIDLMRSIGLDVVDIARSGLIDFVSPSDYYATARDICYSSLKTRLGEDITVYGVIEVLFDWLPVYAPALDHKGGRFSPNRIELVRGDVAGKLVAGADGIEHFNFPAAYNLFVTSPPSCFKDFNNLESLRGLEKLYGSGYLFGTWSKPLFESISHFPASLEPGALKAVRMPMCAEPQDSDLEVVVQVIVEKRERPDIIGLSLNGSWPLWESEETDDLLFDVHGSYNTSPAEKAVFTKHIAKHTAYNFRFKTQDIREGLNDLVILNGNLARCNGRNTNDNYSTFVMFAPYQADRDNSQEERAEHSVVVAGLEVAIRKKTR